MKYRAYDMVRYEALLALNKASRLLVKSSRSGENFLAILDKKTEAEGSSSRRHGRLQQCTDEYFREKFVVWSRATSQPISNDNNFP